MLLGLATIVTVGLPYYLSSQKATALDAKTTSLRSEESDFKAKSASGAKIRLQAVEWNAKRAELTTAMPSDPDVQGAIRSLQKLTTTDIEADHVRWVSATITNLSLAKAAPAPAPTAPVAGAPAPKVTTTVALSQDGESIPSGGFDMAISIEGSRAKILAFVTKIQSSSDDLRRLFAVKSVNLSIQPIVAGGPGPTTTVQNGSEASTLVKADVKLKVTTFGATSAAAASDAVTAKGQVAAGSSATIPRPAAAAASVPTTTTVKS